MQWVRQGFPLFQQPLCAYAQRETFVCEFTAIRWGGCAECNHFKEEEENKVKLFTRSSAIAIAAIFLHISRIECNTFGALLVSECRWYGVISLLLMLLCYLLWKLLLPKVACTASLTNLFTFYSHFYNHVCWWMSCTCNVCLMQLLLLLLAVFS